MEVAELLVSALDAVNEAKIPEGLREIAFSKAIDVLAGQQIGTSRAAAGAPAGAAAGGNAPVTGSKASQMEALSTRLNIDAETLRDVFHVRDDGEIELIFPAGKVDRKLTTGTKQIALLVAAARQASGLEDWTSLGNIRTWCEHYKRLDGPNFATSVKQMDDVFTFRGTGQKREVRMARPGWEKATELVKSIVGASEA